MCCIYKVVYTPHRSVAVVYLIEQMFLLSKTEQTCILSNY